MGRVCVKDLVASDVGEVVVADRDGALAEEVARDVRALAARPGSTVTAHAVDVTGDSLVDLLSGADVVCNCVNYTLNPTVMRAAAKAGTNYLDLGGLFHGTRTQLALADEMTDAGILCLLGMGATPGTMNVMAALGAGELDEVGSIRLRCGGSDPEPAQAALPAPYAIDTILDEFTMPAMVLAGGELAEAPAASDDEEFSFPEPVGAGIALLTLHSELATMPLTFRRLGLAELDFKVAFDAGMIARYRLVTALGLADTAPVTLEDGTEVVPRSLIKALAGTQRFSGRDIESLVVELAGTKGSRALTVRVEELSYPNATYGVGGADANTGIPPSIAAQMIARGAIKGTGVKAPEEVVPPVEYAAELARRNISIEVHVTQPA